MEGANTKSEILNLQQDRVSIINPDPGALEIQRSLGAQGLVTGASRGIGLEFVSQLLESGRCERVFAVYRQPHTAQGLMALQRTWGDRLVLFQGEMTQEEGVERVTAQLVVSHFGNTSRTGAAR